MGCALLALLGVMGCTSPNPAYRPGEATGDDEAVPGVMDGPAMLHPDAAGPQPDAAPGQPDAAASAPDLAVAGADLATGSPDLPFDSPPVPPDTTPDVQTTPVSMTGLVGYWPFDDVPPSSTAADVSANRLAGVLMGLDPRTSWGQGRVGGAILFPLAAPDAGIQVPLTAPVRNIQRFTFSAWVNHARDDGGHHAIVSRQLDDTSREVYFFGFDGPLLTLYVAPPTPNNTIELKVPVAAVNVWVHVAASYDGSAIRLFAGGKQIGQTPHALTLATSTKPLILGTNKNVGTPNQVWDGWLDEVTVWSVALPEAKIAELASGRSLMIIP
jgi:hypothetical protein